jgi:hypothetical protein
MSLLTSWLGPKLHVTPSVNHVHSVIGASLVVCIYQCPPLPVKLKVAYQVRSSSVRWHMLASCSIRASHGAGSSEPSYVGAVSLVVAGRCSGWCANAGGGWLEEQMEWRVEPVARCRTTAVVAPPMVREPPDLVPLAQPPMKLPVRARLPVVVAGLVAQAARHHLPSVR